MSTIVESVKKREKKLAMKQGRPAPTYSDQSDDPRQLLETFDEASGAEDLGQTTQDDE